VYPSRAKSVGELQGDEPRRATAMKKHNHSSDDRLVQYRGKYSRHSGDQSLTNMRQIAIKVPDV
jgi:hypothetical protein